MHDEFCKDVLMISCLTLNIVSDEKTDLRFIAAADGLSVG
jgi:hypothetical protein